MKTFATGLVVLLLLQEGPEAQVKRQAARLDSPKALDALGWLVDLSEAAPKEVDAALAGAPAFYRDVAASERAVRAKAGARFGKVERVTLDVEKKPWREVLDEIRPKLPAGLDMEHMRRMPEGEGVTLKLDAAPAIEAVFAFAKAAGLGIWTHNGRFGLYPGGGSPVLGNSSYRNFLTVLQDLRKVRATDFGDDAGRSAIVRLGFFSDGGAEAVLAPDVRPEILEAVDDLGRALPEFPPRRTDFPGNPGWRTADISGFFREARVRMVDDKAERIAFLRGVLRVRVPMETSHFGFSRTSPNGEKVTADGITAEWIGATSADGATVVRVKLTGPGKPAELAALPVAIRAQPKTGSEMRPGYRFRELADGIEISIEMGDTDDEGNPIPPERVEVLVHRTCVERKIPFEFRDLPLK